MEKSKVYFTDFRATNGQTLLQKLEKLMIRAGMEQIDFENKFGAIKIHFGEPGNLAYLRPNYAKVVADLVKKTGWQAVFDGLQHPVSRTPQKCAGAYGCGL